MSMMGLDGEDLNQTILDEHQSQGSPKRLVLDSEQIGEGNEEDSEIILAAAMVGMEPGSIE